MPDSRKGFERLAEEISEELTVSTTELKVFCLRIISFSSLQSELSSDSKDSEINFDPARSTTVKSLLEALRFANIYFKRRRGRHLGERAACILGMES